MPEGPETRKITDQLNELLKGTILKGIEVTGPHKKFAEDIKKYLEPLLNKSNKFIRITKVDCKGKFIYFQLVLYQGSPQGENVAKSVRYLGNHLGMTGHWRKDEGKHTMVKLTYSVTCDGVVCNTQTNTLYFDDMRHFAKFFWLTKEELNEKLDKLGPDVLSKKFTEEIFNDIMNLKGIQNKMIAKVLLDQDILSGIGNYLRADILYLAQIHPQTKVKDIVENKNVLKALYTAITETVRKAYEQGGTTIRTYKTIDMQPGGYIPVIYNKKTDSLGNPVKTMNLSGRTMWYVPALQKL